MAVSVLMAVCLLGPLAWAANAQEAVAPRTDFRKEISSAYKFVPHAEVAPEPVPGWSLRLVMPEVDSAADESEELVKLAPFEVSGGYRDRGLHSRLMRQKADAHAKEVLNKVGIGVHQKKAGKIWVSASTIFWVPFQVGLSW